MADDAPDQRAVLASLLNERTVDIITTGRRSGRIRTTEIWTTAIEGRIYICGTPNAGRDGVERTPRDWLANLIADPSFTLRLKRGIQADLPASAEQVTDPEQRRHLLSVPATEYYRNAVSLQAAVRHSPIVAVSFRDDAAWLNDVIADEAADRS